MKYLRQSTASQTRTLGPFLSDSDGKTAATALTIANTDVKLMANGGTSANKNSGGGTHRANGHYSVTFNATDTATVGELTVSVSVSGALPVWDKFFVLEEAVFDALFAASAAGPLTTLGTNAPAGWVNAAAIASDAITAAKIAASALNGKGDWLNAAGIRTAVGLASANLDTQLATIDGVADAIKVVTDKLATAIESDGASGWQFTTLALENGPSGGGGGGDDAATIYTYFTSSSRQDAFKATGFSTLDAAGIRAAVGLASANLDTQLATIDGVADDVKVVTDKLATAIESDGASGWQFTTLALENGPSGGGGGGDATAANQTAILEALAELHDFDPATDTVTLSAASIAAIEAALINDGDATTLLQAFADKIAAANPSLGDLTLAAIASAVWGNGTRTLTAQSDSSGVTTLLSRIPSTLTITGGAVDVNGASVRAAVGLASANLDTQLTTITGRLWTTAELAQLRYVLGIDGTATAPTSGTSHLSVTVRPSIVIDANTPIVTEGLSFELTAKDDYANDDDITPIGPIRIETDLDLLRVTNPPTLRFGATQRLGSKLSKDTFIDGTAYAVAVAGEPNQFDLFIEIDHTALTKPPGAYSWDVEAVFGETGGEVRTLVDGLLTLKASMGSY